AAAENARDWIDRNITTGKVNELITHLRVAEGEPQLSLDFTYSDLSAQYISGMSPIEGATGRGHLTFHDFFLHLDSATVGPLSDETISLSGSSMVFRDLWGVTTPTEVALSGSGDLTAVLSLIDQQPLELVSKLSLQPSDITGYATVDAAFAFPLLNDLLIDQIFVDVSAALEDVTMPFKVAGRSLSVTGEAVRLDGSVERMTVAGEVEVDQTPVALSWTENYGEGADDRLIEIAGKVTPELLAAFDSEIPGFDMGSAEATIAVDQSAGITSFDVRADLLNAALAIDGIGWSKSPGQSGQLEVAGDLDPVVSIDRVKLASNGLDVLGSVMLRQDRVLERAVFERFRLKDVLDVAVTLEREAETIVATLSGQRIDLGKFSEERNAFDDGKSKQQIRAEFDVAELALSESHALAPARGRYEQSSDSASADVVGLVTPNAEVSIAYNKSGRAPAGLSVKSEQSGEILEYFGIYEGATGGNLNINASVDPDAETTLSGIMKIRGLIVSEGEDLRQILKTGRFADEQVEEISSGITFRSIRVPFDVSGSSIKVGESFAKSPSIAITAQGEIDPDVDKVDLIGVISPAYGLSSALDEVPILGQLLTGGEGEGLLGMTFSVSGSLDDPQISVNPLSLLTPGILRGVFSGKSTPSERVILPKER
ncbi:MAG: AsmA-like C-terminal domain-containing protein, partial [Pseudomonadota bacterium]